jgi:hypothetical protein
MKRNQNNIAQQLLIREYVKAVLLTESGADAAEAGVGGTEGWSKFFGTVGNVGSTVMGKSKEMLQNVKTAVRLSLETILASTIPWIDAEYKKIREENKDAIAKVREEYKDVYAATDAVFQRSDVKFMLLAANPAAFLTGPVLDQSTDAAINILDAVTGGYVPEDKMQKLKKFARKVGKVTVAGAAIDTYKPPTGAKSENYIRSNFGMPLVEAGKKDENKNKEELKKIIQDILKRYGTKTVPKMQNDVKKFHQDFLNKNIQFAENFKKIQKIEQLPQEVRSKIKLEISEEELKKMAQEGSTTPEKIKEQLVNNALAQAKAKGIERIVKNITDTVESMKKEGLTQENPISKLYQQAIQKIQAK